MKTGLFKTKARMLAAAFSAAALLLSASAEARVYRVQTSQNAGDATFRFVAEKWLPKLKAMTGGEIEIELLPTGAVVPPKETLDAISAGVLDGGHEAVSRFTGKNIAYALLADLVSAYDNPDQAQTFCMNGRGLELLRNLHKKYSNDRVHVVGCSPYARESLPSKVPMRGVSDMKGVKIRAPEGLPAELFKRAGASSVPLPFSEVYNGLDKGIIDAADASSFSNNDSSGMHEIAKYPIYPGIHSQAVLHLMFNKDVWDGWTPAQQTMVEVWYEAMIADLRRDNDLRDKALVAKYKAAGGDVEIIDWTLAERNKLREVAQGAWESFAERTPEAREVYEAQVEFLKLYGLLQ